MRYTAPVGEAATPGAQSHRQIAPGTAIGRYRVLKRIAAGGMAEVYLARAEGGAGLARPVALKLVLPHLSQESKFVTLFQHEARVALLLDHPYIAQVLELDRDGSELFLVMEFVDGHTLLDVLAASQGPLPLSCALSLIAQTCAAIHHAHEAKKPDGTALELVHRDISPSNVMVRHDGVVKVVDFGIAKALSETGLTKTGSLKGKAGYMSPEQCRGQALDRRSDIFNLGILLYETTLGRRAFGGSNMFAIMNKIVDGRFTAPSKVLPDYPAALEAIVLRALSLDREDRHPTAHAIREEIEAFARAEGIALSEPVVASTIEQLMGQPEPVELTADPMLPRLPEAEEFAKPAAGLPGWLKATAVGVAAGAVAFIVLRQTDTPEAKTSVAPETEGAVVEPTAATVAAPGVAPEAELVGAAETSAPPPPDPKAEVLVPDVEGPQAATASAAPRRKGPRRKRRSQPAKKKSVKKTESEPLFPWKDEPQ